MRRFGIVMMALALVSTLTLSSCSSTSAGNVTKALEAIAEVSSDQIIEVRIREGAEIEALVFHNGETVGYTYYEGEVTENSILSGGNQLGWPRTPEQWDIEAILDSYPEQCQGKRFIARALHDDQYLIDVDCNHSWVKTVIGDHSFVEIDDWTSPEALQTFMDEARLLTGSSTVHDFGFDASTSTVDLSIVTAMGYRADGTPCERGNFSRMMKRSGDTTVQSIICFNTQLQTPDMPFSLRDINPTQLAATFQIAADQAGKPLSEVRYLDVRTTPLPNEFTRLEPYVFAMWYTDEPQTSHKLALSLSGELLYVEQIP